MLFKGQFSTAIKSCRSFSGTEKRLRSYDTHESWCVSSFLEYVGLFSFSPIVADNSKRGDEQTSTKHQTGSDNLLLIA